MLYLKAVCSQAFFVCLNQFWTTFFPILNNTFIPRLFGLWARAAGLQLLLFFAVLRRLCFLGHLDAWKGFSLILWPVTPYRSMMSFEKGAAMTSIATCYLGIGCNICTTSKQSISLINEHYSTFGYTLLHRIRQLLDPKPGLEAPSWC